jgi:hypothetical protein
LKEQFWKCERLVKIPSSKLAEDFGTVVKWLLKSGCIGNPGFGDSVSESESEGDVTDRA